MNRLTVLILLAGLAVASTAAAAPLEPLPFEPLAGRGPALCLSATGAPGGIALLGPYSRRQSATDLLTVRTDGASRSGRVEIGRMFECAAVAEAPGGAAVVASTTVDTNYEPELRAVVRDPGGAFGEPVVLSRRGTDAVAAVGPAGHAVVAWSEKRGRRHRIVAARRSPGGAFAAPETLVDARTDQQMPETHLAATVDAQGVVTLVWSRELPSDDFDEHVEAGTAAAGAPFVVQRLGDGVSLFREPVLAGAADGWAMAAFKADDLQVFERAPGGAFRAVDLPDLPGRDATRTDVTAAVREGGGAVLAWRVHGSRRVSGIEALTRGARGAAWSVRRVAGPGPSVSDELLVESLFNPFDFLGGPPADGDRRELEAAVFGDGRVVLAWTSGAGRAPLRTETAHALTGSLDGTFEAPRRLGSALRSTEDLAPLVLPDGRAAVAWTDASGVADGRLHVAVEGAPPRTAAATPRLTVSAPRTQLLFPRQPPRVFAGCDAACDLRTITLGPRGDRSEPSSQTSLTGRRARLRVDTTWRPGPVKVIVHAGAPAGDRVTARSVRIRVEHRRPLPLRRPLGVTARRRGDEIVVRWRTAAPARRQYFIVAGQGRDDRIEAGLPGTLRLLEGRGRERFTVRLRPPASVRVPWVAVVAASADTDAERDALVKVR